MNEAGEKSNVPVVTTSAGLGWTEVLVSDVGRAADVTGEDNTDSKTKFSISLILKSFKH